MSNRIHKECKVHGITEHCLWKNKYPVCVECNRQRVYQWRRDAKEKLVEAHGGACKNCGYNKCKRALQFHHLDPESKKFSISAFSSCMNYSKLLEESNKCILLCANCHAEIEDGCLKVKDFIDS